MTIEPPEPETFFIGQLVKPNEYAAVYYRGDISHVENSDCARRSMTYGIVVDIRPQGDELAITVDGNNGTHHFRACTLTNSLFVIEELP